MRELPTRNAALNLAKRQIIQGNLAVQMACNLYEKAKKNCHFLDSCVCFQFLNRDCAKQERDFQFYLDVCGLILIILFVKRELIVFQRSITKIAWEFYALGAAYMLHVSVLQEL